MDKIPDAAASHLLDYFSLRELLTFSEVSKESRGILLEKFVHFIRKSEVLHELQKTLRWNIGAAHLTNEEKAGNILKYFKRCHPSSIKDGESFVDVVVKFISVNRTILVRIVGEVNLETLPALRNEGAVPLDINELIEQAGTEEASRKATSILISDFRYSPEILHQDRVLARERRRALTETRLIEAEMHREVSQQIGRIVRVALSVLLVTGLCSFIYLKT